MKDKPEGDLASQMMEARQLLEDGEVREALVLAMDVLWRELDQLRETIKAVQETLPPMPETTDTTPEESARTGFYWPEPLSNQLH